MSKTVAALVGVIIVLVAALAWTIGKSQGSAPLPESSPSEKSTLESDTSHAADSAAWANQSQAPFLETSETNQSVVGNSSGEVRIAGTEVPYPPETTPATALKNEISVYRGGIRYPDFRGRDKDYADYRTRITDNMKAGPNFSGRYNIIQFGCGTGCSFVIVADSSTGRLYDFPYGGEEHSMLDLTYGIKSNFITAKFVQTDLEGNEASKCVVDEMSWNGSRFTSLNKRVIGDSSRCYD